MPKREFDRTLRRRQVEAVRFLWSLIPLAIGLVVLGYVGLTVFHLINPTFPRSAACVLRNPVRLRPI